MSLVEIAWFAKLEASVFLAALAAIVSYRLLNGQINTKGLLYGTKKGGGQYFRPERVQLLLFTLGAAMFYLSDVLQHRTSGGLPDVPKETLALLGGSNAIYLTGKAYMMLLKKPSEGE